MRTTNDPPETCPNCGADVPSNARACPECGADEQTGWSGRAHAQRLNLPDDEFDYDEFVACELEGKPSIRRGPQKLWWLVALGLLIVLLLLWFWR